MDRFLPSSVAYVMLCSAGLKRYPFLRQIVIELAALMIAFVFPNAVPPILNTLPLSFLRGPAAAAGFALYNTVGLLGGFAGPCILGALKESTGAYTSGMMVLALGMTVSAAIVLALGRAMAPRSVFTRDAKVS